MENNNDDNNNTNIEPEIKKKMTQAQKDGQKRYYNKVKLNPEFQEVRRAYSKKHYDNNKTAVIERVRRYQAKVQEFETAIFQVL